MEVRLGRIPSWARLGCAVLGLLAVSSTAEAQLTLTWVDNAVDENGFRVERRTSPSGSYGLVGTVPSNVATYLDATVTPGQAYCYRVQAYNSAGSSGFTNEACATAPTLPPPSVTL